LFDWLSIDAIKTAMTSGHGFWGGALTSFTLLFSCGLGLPLPEDVPLILSGALLCHSVRTWIICGTLNWLGIMGGDICLYWISRSIGLRVTQLPLIRNHVTIERIEKVRDWFETYGIAVVGIGRLVAGIRGAMVITAGATKYNFTKFIIADGFAAMVSGGIFMVLGWWVGDHINDATIHRFKEWFIGGAILLAVAVVLYFVWKRRSHPAKLPDVQV